MRAHRTLAFAFLFIALPSTAIAQAADSTTLRVRVIDEGSESAIAGAQVGVPELERFALTGRDGIALLRLPAGERVLEVTMLGYSAASGTVSLAPAQALFLEVELANRPIDLAGITVTVQSTKLLGAGFYERALEGSGYRMDREQIERGRPRTLADLVQGLAPGIRITRDLDVWDAYFGSRSSSFMLGSAQCYPTIYVDGAIAASGSRRAPEFDMRRVRGEEIEGVEVYTGAASVPPSLNATGSSCGVIAVWTRR